MSALPCETFHVRLLVIALLLFTAGFPKAAPAAMLELQAVVVAPKVSDDAVGEAERKSRRTWQTVKEKAIQDLETVADRLPHGAIMDNLNDDLRDVLDKYVASPVNLAALSGGDGIGTTMGQAEHKSRRAWQAVKEKAIQDLETVADHLPPGAIMDNLNDDLRDVLDRYVATPVNPIVPDVVDGIGSPPDLAGVANPYIGSTLPITASTGASVPEPSTTSLVALASAGVAAMARRRRSTSAAMPYRCV